MRSGRVYVGGLGDALRAGVRLAAVVVWLLDAVVEVRVVLEGGVVLEVWVVLVVCAAAPVCEAWVLLVDVCVTGFWCRVDDAVVVDVPLGDGVEVAAALVLVLACELVVLDFLAPHAARTSATKATLLAVHRRRHR